MSRIDIAATITSWCATCRRDGPFQRPECLDDHGGDCPEWMCVDCGEAVVVGFALPEMVVGFEVPEVVVGLAVPEPSSAAPPASRVA